MTSVLTLLLDDEATCLVAPGSSPLRIAPGVEALVRRHLSGQAPLAYAMESAIAAIEDELARVPRDMHRHPMISRSQHLIEMARFACLDNGGVLRRDGVEQLFARQAAVALGRPEAQERLPDSRSFVASVLLTRELMHHLDIDAITLLP